MPLQEAVLRAASLRFEWALSPRLPDVAGALTDVLRAATGSLEDWTWDSGPSGPAIIAWDDDGRLHILITPNRLVLVTEIPDLDKLTAAAEATVVQCAETLHLSEMTGSGGGAIWTLAAEDIGEAEEAMEAWLFSSELRTRLDPLGGRPDDLDVTIRFDAPGGVETQMRVEPATDAYAAASSYFASEMDESEFPPASLIVEVDRIQYQQFSSSEALGRATRHVEHILTLSKRLLATVQTP